jgi:hypothetical protein
VVVIRPILLPVPSVNHRAPSGPETNSGRHGCRGWHHILGNNPRVVIRRIRLPCVSVNQSAPSGPEVMLEDSLSELAPGIP